MSVNDPVLFCTNRRSLPSLFTLFDLGIKDVRLVPSLQPFITPNVLNVRVKNFSIKPIASTPETDLEEILGSRWSTTRAECLEANKVTV
jgi:hydroxylamine reductase